MGYLPNRNAQNLASTRSNLVGLVTHGLTHIGPTQVLVQLEEAAKARGYNVIVIDVDGNIDSIHAAVDQLCSYQVLGIQVNFPLDIDFRFFREIAQRVPIVLHDVSVGSDVPSAVFRHEQAAQLLTEHLISLGHEQIAFLGGLDTWIVERKRRRSWLRCLQKAALKPGPILHCDWTVAGAYERTRELLRDCSGQFTALIGGSDLMVVGALKAIRESRLRVPDQISVCGFGDYPFAAYLEPPLTTVRQDFSRVGAAGFECLMSVVENPDCPARHLTIEPELIVRQSTGPVARRTKARGLGGRAPSENGRWSSRVKRRQ
jgi:DNA-binding LacI/PurR family transcriptional regulator